jgi:hypothetical protein
MLTSSSVSFNALSSLQSAAARVSVRCSTRLAPRMTEVMAGFASTQATDKVVINLFSDQQIVDLITVSGVYITLAMFWIAYRHLPESRDAEAKLGLDWRGAILVLLGLGGLVYGLIAAPISGWSDPIVLASLIGGSVSLVGVRVR